MKTKLNMLGTIIAGFYAWIIAVFFGGVLLDVSYANILDQYLSIPDRTATFSKISDILLALGVVMILAALGAIALSRGSKAARILFITSFIIVIFEFITPFLLSQFAQGAQTLVFGPWIRIALSGSASLLAFAGLTVYSRLN